MVFKLNTVEPRFTHTRLKRTPRYFGQFPLSPGKALTFSLNSSRLIRSLVNGENGHSILAQSTNSHRKPATLMRTFLYQLCAVIDVSFLKVKKSFKLTECRRSPRYHTPDRMIFRVNFWHQTCYA